MGLVVVGDLRKHTAATRRRRGQRLGSDGAEGLRKGSVKVQEAKKESRRSDSKCCVATGQMLKEEVN